MFRSLGLLGSSAPLTKVIAVKPQWSPTQNRLATGQQNLTGPIRFDFTGYPDAQRRVLQDFVNANYANMVAVYGVPAPEQAGKTVTVRFEEKASAYIPPLPGGANGGTIVFGYNGIPKSGVDPLRAVNTYNFTRLALIAFQGPRVPAFDFLNGNYVEPWLYGMADAGALQVAYLAGGSRADFNPSAVSTYALSVYDYLNRPELGNAYIYSKSERESELAISFFRAAMAQSAFLKIAVENPQFFAQFNARLYARGAAGASISSSDLKGLAAGVVPTVEGRDFNDWARAQYALDATVTTGQKLYLLTLPLATSATNTAPSATVIAEAFTTQNDGSETASTGFASLRAFDENGVDISAQSGDLARNNVLAFTNADRPGEAEGVVGFGGLGPSNSALITLKARFGQAEATNYVPYGAAGNATSVSSYFGGIIGAPTGSLQVSGSSGTQNVSVTRGTWAATLPYQSGARVQTAFSFGGATVRRNSAWLSPSALQRSIAFLLELPSSLQNLNFNTPAGQSQIRMVSIPGFPTKTDEAAALNLAPADLKLARYRPNLSAATVAADGSLQFGIGGDRYELYPNISGPIVPGRGYWLGVGQNGYATTVQASPPPTDKPYEVPIGGGWNQIGVPFNRTFAPGAIKVRYGGIAPVSLSEAQTRGWVAPGLWRWRPEGGYVRIDVDGTAMAPFEGYFLFSGLERGVSLVFEPNASAVAAKRAQTEAGAWSVSLQAKGDKTDDIAGRFGVSSAPNIAKPPAGARVISLRFAGSDVQGASSSGSGLAEAYLPKMSENASWTAIVDGAAVGENVTVKWGKFEGAASRLRLSLLDNTTNSRVLMKSGGSYRFVAGEQPRRLTISAALTQIDPKVAPTLAPASVTTADVLTVSPNASGFGDDSKLVYSYVWRNGERVLNETSATLDLSKSGNGDRGDVISVEVTARDEQGNLASGTARVTVGNSNPFVADGTLRVQTGVQGSVVIASSDADGDELQIARSNSPARGVAQVRKVNGEWTLFYSSYKGATGDDKVELIAIDGNHGRSKTATIQIAIGPNEVSNRAPVAVDGAVDSARGAGATIALMASDPDGDALTFRQVRGAQFGSSEIALDAADGKWKMRTTNTSKPENGTDSVQFVAVDIMGRESNVATITIRLRNRVPVAADVSGTVVSGAEIAIPVSGSDADGGALTFLRVGGPSNGTGGLRLDSDGIWKMFYRSRAGWTGVEDVRYVTLDDEGRPSAPATISITVTPANASKSSAISHSAPGASASGS